MTEGFIGAAASPFPRDEGGALLGLGARVRDGRVSRSAGQSGVVVDRVAH